MQMPAERTNLLCVANFPPNTGYAWDFIERLFADIADLNASRGGKTYVAYPKIAGDSTPLACHAAAAVELAVDTSSLIGICRLVRFVRRHKITHLYLVDRSAWQPVFPVLRMAGVCRIVVHDHTSGTRTTPRGLRRALKWGVARWPAVTADCVIAVSEYVATRNRTTNLLPHRKVHVVYNSVPKPAATVDSDAARRMLLERGDLSGPTGPIVGAVGRATPEKGFQHLIAAFDRVCERFEHERRDMPTLILIGDGPYRGALLRQCGASPFASRIHMLGYQPDAADLLTGADVAVVPSVWEEAFGLSAVEPMLRGVAVIASAVGGLREIVLDGRTGLSVPPADERALADAIAALLDDPIERRRLAAAGREFAEQTFAPPRLTARLAELVLPGVYDAATDIVSGARPHVVAAETR